MPIEITPTLVPLSNLGVIRAVGPDTQSYLQGQLTCNLVKLAPDAWTWGGHCDPKGKLITAFRLTRIEDGVLMLMPKGQLNQDLPALNKYAVFNKVEISDASADYKVYGLLGQNALALLPGEGSVRALEGGVALIDGERAVVVMAADASLPEALAALPQEAEALWIASEIEAGRPWFDEAQCLEFVPQMLNLDAIGGIQYDKGCYIGQETVARMHFRGGNKRAMYALCGAPAEGDLQMQLGENWRRAGTLVAEADWGGQRYIAVVMSKELEPDTAFRRGEEVQTLLPRPYPLFEQ
ncbi:folate-binding protein YgfZ [Ferrimonas balearica DSM 9799]|uniref:Folate-binding protein YgfZ n=1 Tax=Ferrimonas balearica (strain DSM 9799 / CCM 4581 / KCTC 23876 / PAT) TaxID=550540 RepID=E1SRS6_FERBD|nr:folate-binding protein YgfZ [Ferrimonas balearica]ADN74895.1 folate-binding protein YgfZ [Ferrimonas balearica DSM 9799]